MRLYGLIGMPLSQSFSKKYFTEKFQTENIRDAQYELYPLENIALLQQLLVEHPALKGLNVTIPYKELVLAYLDSLNVDAKNIGAVNGIKINNGKLEGYNTDAPAFKKSLLPQLKLKHKKALILGTGGAAKAVQYVLHSLGIEYAFVSRNKSKGLIYDELTAEILKTYPLIINTTPLGSFPKTDTSPDIPYEFLTPGNYLYDLVYNPAKTSFLQKGEESGAAIKNGYDMLVEQAELSWEIWNNPAR